MTDINPTIIEKARRYCDYQERCQQELRDKLYAWELRKDQVESLISLMITEGYINEERYAKAFARGKFRIKQWGRKRIENELKLRRISDYCIRAALKEIDPQEYEQTLIALLRKKSDELNPSPLRDKKMFEYAFYKGFESDLIRTFLKIEPME